MSTPVMTERTAASSPRRQGRRTRSWLTTSLLSAFVILAGSGLVVPGEQFHVRRTPAPEQPTSSQVGFPAATRRCLWQSAWSDLRAFASAVRAARALAVLFDDDSRQPRSAPDPVAPVAGHEPSTLQARVSESREPGR
jgi:hypothetical protein